MSAYEKKKTNLHIFIDIFMNFVFAVSEQLNECFELVPYDRIESLFGEILWRPFLMETLWFGVLTENVFIFRDVELMNENVHKVLCSAHVGIIDLSNEC